jgi:ribosomal-protein-alanine N-acetyltransferase
METLGTYKLSPLDNLVHIRWLVRKDMPAVLSIDQRWTENEFLTQLRRREVIGMVAEKFTQILGFMVYELDEDRVRLLNLAVHPDWRRSRIGTQMVTKLKRKLASHRRRKLEVVVPDSELTAHQFLQFNEMKATVVKDDYHFIYETNGEDEHVF